MARQRAEETRLRQEQEARLRAEELARQQDDEHLSFDDVLADEDYSSNQKRNRTEETEEDYLSINLEPQKRPKRHSNENRNLPILTILIVWIPHTRKQKSSGSSDSKSN